MRFIRFWQSNQAALPPRPPLKTVALAWMGGMATISLFAWLGQTTHLAWLLGSFGASAVLVFGFPHAPFSQPRNILIGYGLSVAAGFCTIAFLGAHWWALGLAVGTAIALMMLTRTVHPPAGSSPVLVFALHPDWQAFVLACLGGAGLLVGSALAWYRVTRHQQYPLYW